MAASRLTEFGHEAMLRHLRAYTGDSRNAQLKRASRRGNCKYRPRPVGILEREGVPDPSRYQIGFLDSKKLRGRLTEEDEMSKRAVLLRQAWHGDEQALAFLRDELRVETWIHKGRKLIVDGVLVGVRE